MATQFQRRRLFRNRQTRIRNYLWWPCLLPDWVNQHILQRTFHRCFLPNFGSFGQAVSKDFFLEIDQSETRSACDCNVCNRIGTKRSVFIKDLPQMRPTKFRFIWPSGFRRNYFLEIDQSETRSACDCNVCNRIETKRSDFIKDLPQMRPTKFWFIWPSSYRGKYLFRN